MTQTTPPKLSSLLSVYLWSLTLLLTHSAFANGQPVANADTIPVAEGQASSELNLLQNDSSNTDPISPSLSLDAGAGDENFNNGTLHIEIASSVSTELLSLITVETPNTTSGVISISDGIVYRGDGTSAISIGSIDNTLDGTGGKDLKISLSDPDSFLNGDFQLSSSSTQVGDTNEYSFPGWSVFEERVQLDGLSTIQGYPTPTDNSDPANASSTDNAGASSITYDHSIGVDGVPLYWSSVASSDDGQLLLAVSQYSPNLSSGGNFWITQDGGSSWTEIESPDSTQVWISVAVSGDGSLILAASSSGYLWTSTDAGSTWTQHTSIGSTKNWRQVTANADGTKLAAVVSSGNIWTSSDSGATWTEDTSIGATQNWWSITSSADGSKLAAVAVGGNIWTSSDSGATWTEDTSVGATKNWYSITSSADGSKLAAVVISGNIWTSSDSGATWSENTSIGSTKSWYSITSNADGSKLAAVAVGGNIWTSSDFGATWTEDTSVGATKSWLSIASNADGSQIVAVAQNDSVWGSGDGGTTFNTLGASVDRSQGGGNAIQLTLNGFADGYAVIHGPTLVSDPAFISANSTVEFEWRAAGASDAYDVYAYLLNTDTGATIELLNNTGDSGSAETDWDTVQKSVLDEGNYSFIFVSGSFDFSGGSALGAKLLVDSIKINQAIPQSAPTDKSNLQDILNLLEYSNSAGLASSGVRTITANATEADIFGGSTLSATANLGGGVKSVTVDSTTTVLSAVSEESSGDYSGFKSIPAQNGSILYIKETGEVIYLHGDEENTSETFDYLITDGVSDSGTATVTLTVTPVNDPPSGVDTTISAVENNSYIFSAADFGFSDTDGNSFATLTVVTLPEAGQLQLSSVDVTASQVVNLADIPNLTFTPATDSLGSGYASFTFAVGDDGGTENNGLDTDPNPKTLTIDVVPDNELPVLAAIGTQSLDEDTIKSITLSATDADEDPLTFSANSSANISASISGTTLTLTPSANWFGTENITVEVTDDVGEPVSETFSVTVNSVNDAPVLDSVGNQMTDEDLPKMITLSASDLDMDDLTYSAVSSANISATVSGTTMTLTPNPNWFGSATVTVAVEDGNGGSDSEVIQVTVTSVNDLPVLGVLGAQATDEDMPKNLTLSATDVEDDAQNLIFSASSSAVQVSASVTGTQLSLTSQANWFGTVNITVTVTDTDDGEDSETFVFTVNSVNDLPTIQNPGDQEFTEKDVHPVTLSFSDIETSSPSISVTTSDPGLQTDVQGATLNLTADGWYGGATVTVTVTDEDDGTDSETFNVTVEPFNIHPPVHTVPEEQQIDTSVPYIFSIANENAVQVSDLDSPTVTTTLEVQYGILKLHQTTGLQFLEGTSDSSAKIVITGAIGDVNAALDGLRYCSTTGYVGGDTISLHTKDHGELTDTDDILLTVEIVALPGQPNLQVSTLVEPGKTLTEVSIESFDDTKLQLAEFTGEGENLELAILPIGKQDGSQDHSTVEIELTYDDGTTEIVTVPVVIYHAKLAVTQEVQGIAQINRSTGLYESIVEVENTTPYTMEAIRIHVDDIKGGAELKTITGTGDDGVPYVQYDVPLTPGEVQNFKLEFKVPGRRWDDPTTSIVLELLPEASAEEIVAEPVSLGEEINQAQDQSFYISFETEEAQTYYIQYADTIEGPWKTSPISVLGDNLRQVWVDDGPPKTLTHPSEETSRVYRIVVPVENQDQD